MKLGLAYNIFNGEEFLLDSLQRMRPYVEYITLVIQTVSNTGNQKEGLFDFMGTLPKELYDSIVLFIPDLTKSAQENELDKRNKGLSECLSTNCTHFMSIDCDEFYDMDDFNLVKNWIGINDIEGSVCQLKDYFKSPTYQINSETKSYVPFISKIDENSKHILGETYPVPIDPTRKLNRNTIHIFSENTLVMHHMSYIRKDMRSKLENSSNVKMFEGVIEDYLNYFKSWKYGQPAMNPHQFKKKNVISKNNIKIVNLPFLKNLYTTSMKYTVIIPTMWKAQPYLMIMLRKYEDNPLIGEILLINNEVPSFSLSKLEVFKKVRILNDGENLFVNPSWNLGVTEAQYENIILANDDINILRFDETLFAIDLALESNRIIGFAETCFKQKNKGKILGTLQVNRSSHYTMKYGFGVFMVMKKNKYSSPPEVMKVWYGDMFLYAKLRPSVLEGTEVITPMQTTTSALNLSSQQQIEKGYFLNNKHLFQKL